MDGSTTTDTAGLNQANLKRTITLPQALGVSFHQIVGGGVVSLTGVAIAYTGGGVPLAFLMAAIAIMIVSVPYASLGAAMPVTGGTYTYGTRLLHPGLGFLNLWLFVIAMASLSLYGLTAGTYLHTLNSWFNPTWVAVCLIAFFYLANMMGASFSARVGLFIAGIMLVAFAVFIVTGLAHTHWGSYPPVVPNGLYKLFEASALLTFATGGGTVVAELGHEMKNPGKTIPIATLGGTVFAALLYILIALPAAGVLPIPQVAGQPLSVVAKVIMPHGFWVFFILGGAVLAVIGTMNAQLLWGSKSLLASIDDGWFPKQAGAVNKRFGTPHFLLTLLFIVGIVPAVAHISISVIANAGSAIGQVVFVIILAASLRMRYVRPDLQRTSPFKLRADVHWAFTIVGTGVCGYQTYLLTRGLSNSVYVALVTWLAIGAVWFVIRYPHVKRTMAARTDTGEFDRPVEDDLAVALPANAPAVLSEADLMRTRPAGSTVKENHA